VESEHGAVLDGGAVHGGIERNHYAEHPVTGIRFSGERLPMWEDTVALCRRAAALFPYELVAVDVAFPPDSPLIIELGATPDDHQIAAGHGFGPMVESLLARVQR
jgi:hypothetical protein